MKTAPLSPPPRPPRTGNSTSGFYEWHGGPNPGSRQPRHWWHMFLKFVVLVLFAMAAGQLALIIFQTVRLWFFS
jgi:hypothetical protein